jgi:hypothetical protein
VFDRVESAWQLFETLSEAVDVLEVETRAGRVVPAQFVGLTPEELVEAFTELRGDLDEVGILRISSAAEATLRLDFEERVRTRSPRGPLTNEFRRIKRERQRRVRLKEDILWTWRDHFGAHTPEFKAINRFGETLGLRHWLVHGQHWTLKSAVPRSPAEVRTRASDLFTLLPDFPR